MKSSIWFGLGLQWNHSSIRGVDETFLRPSLFIRDVVLLSDSGVVHIFVDRESPSGNVYVKCPSVAAAYKSVNSLHGRWFSGKCPIFHVY